MALTQSLAQYPILSPACPVLAVILALAAPAGGCQRSLFDADPGDAGANGPDDSPDAAVVDPGDADAGPGDVDCPSPCVGNAAADFSMTQPNGPWRYADLIPDVGYGTSFNEMMPGEWNGMQGWVTALQDIGPMFSPAIVSCALNAGNPRCQGVEQKLLLAVAERPGAVLYPALLWTAPATGAYRVRGNWRSADTVSETVNGSLLLLRNSQQDVLVSQGFITTTVAIERDFEIEAVAGDVIALAVRNDDPAAASLGVDLFITDLQDPGRCLVAARFEGESDAFPDLCGGGMFVDGTQTGAQCNGMPCPATEDADPPAGIPGRARRFVEGSSMQYQGPPNDYSGDWTLQFWADLEPGGGGPQQWLLSDLDCEAQGGIGIHSDGESLYVELFHEARLPGDCLLGSMDYVAVPGVVGDTDWHFVRIVRRNGQGTVSVCVDGLSRGEIQVPPNTTMPTSRPMTLGRMDDDARFNGRLADLRMFGYALPCGSTP